MSSLWAGRGFFRSLPNEAGGLGPQPADSIYRSRPVSAFSETGLEGPTSFFAHQSAQALDSTRKGRMSGPQIVKKAFPHRCRRFPGVHDKQMRSAARSTRQWRFTARDVFKRAQEGARITSKLD